ncbi:MAG: hypothetical protein OEW13_12490 [Nitrospira sp.]|nr:hypothetical protein [Nitrospira sp.]
MMMEEEREYFLAKLTAIQDEIRAISESAAQNLKPVVLDQTSVGRMSRVDSIQLEMTFPSWPHNCGLRTVYLTSRSDSTSKGSLFMSESLNESQSPLQLHNNTLISMGHLHRAVNIIR